jgi:hypothetical protein
MITNVAADRKSNHNEEKVGKKVSGTFFSSPVPETHSQPSGSFFVSK